MQKIKDKMFSICRILEQSRSMNAINASIVALIPFIIVSSFITVIVQFPILELQNWAQTGIVGGVLQILGFINICMLDCLSLFFSMEIGINYAKREYHNDSTKYILPCVTVSIYLLSVGVFTPDFSQEMLGKSGLFCSIFASLLGCKFYVGISDLMNRHTKNKRKYMDYAMAGALNSIIPSTITIGFFTFMCAII